MVVGDTLDICNDRICSPGSHVRLSLSRENDAGVLVVKSVLCQPHESGVFFHQQDEKGFTLDVVHLEFRMPQHRRTHQGALPTCMQHHNSSVNSHVLD